jgi:hypothetical protein
VTSIREIEELTLELIMHEAKAAGADFTARGNSEVERLRVGRRDPHGATKNIRRGTETKTGLPSTQNRAAW